MDLPKIQAPVKESYRLPSAQCPVPVTTFGSSSANDMMFHINIPVLIKINLFNSRIRQLHPSQTEPPLQSVCFWHWHTLMQTGWWSNTWHSWLKSHGLAAEHGSTHKLFTQAFCDEHSSWLMQWISEIIHKNIVIKFVLRETGHLLHWYQ